MKGEDHMANNGMTPEATSKTQSDVDIEQICCTECGIKVEKTDKLEYSLCQACFKNKIKALKKLWVSDVLGYPLYSVEEFLPKYPQRLIGAFFKDYIIDKSMHKMVEQFFNSHPDKDYSSLNLEKIAHAQKAKLLNSIFEPHKRSCSKCGSEYQADSIWKYTVCISCAESIKYDWQAFWLSEMGYDDEFLGWIPTPPMSVERYLLEEKNSVSNKKMDQEAASRIQSHADRNSKNQGFKARAQATAARNEILE